MTELSAPQGNGSANQAANTVSLPLKKSMGCLLPLLGCGFLSVIGLLLLLIVLVLLDGDKTTQNTPASPQQVNGNTSVNSQSDVLPTPPSLSAALQIVYPEGPFANNIYLYPDEINGSSHWVDGILHRTVPLRDGTIDASTPEAERTMDYLTTASDVVPFEQGGQHKVMVIMGSVPANDSSVEPLLGAAVLVWENQTWVIKSRSDDLTNIGSDGAGVPKGRLAKLGPDRFGYLIDFGWTGQGVVSNMTRIVGQNLEGVLMSLNDLQVGQSNEGVGLGASETYAFSSQIEILTGQQNRHEAGEEDSPRDDYYPLRITHKGTCPGKNGGIVPVNLSVIYQMYDEGYVPLLATDSTDPIYNLCVLN